VLARRGILLVAITGAAHSGKSALAEGFIQRNFRKYSFAAPLKTMLAQLAVLRACILNDCGREGDTQLTFYGKKSKTDDADSWY
jgi:hypothetical protein